MAMGFSSSLPGRWSSAIHHPYSGSNVPVSGVISSEPGPRGVPCSAFGFILTWTEKRVGVGPVGDTVSAH